MKNVTNNIKFYYQYRQLFDQFMLCITEDVYAEVVKHSYYFPFIGLIADEMRRR